jgi:hypothetical protein
MHKEIAMTQSTALIPISERIVDFYGDPIYGLIVPGDEQPIIYVPLRPLCGYLGLDWSAQYRRLHRDTVLREVIRPVAMTATGSPTDEHEVVCLPLEYLPGWLFSVNVTRVRPALQDKITQYRRECFKVLWRAFQAEAMGLAQTQMAPADPAVQEAPLATTSTSMLLVQLRDQALAQYQLAEQQLSLEARVATHDERFQRAAIVIRNMQQRLGALEERIQPAELITEAEASEVGSQVKALAEALTQRDASKNHYQSIFSELNRRFRVASYRRLSRAQLAPVLQFLDEWRAQMEVERPSED